MATLTETARISDIILFQVGEAVDYVIDQVTLISGGSACAVGQILGQIIVGAATAATKSGGNTGNGTCVVDATTPTLINAKPGVYTVRCTIAGTNSATFIVIDPTGVSLGTGSCSGSGASFTFADRVKFVITDGSTDFIVGDGFDITVPAGSGKWTQVAPAANDGSAVAAGVCILAGNPASADVISAALTRGPAILKTSALAYTAGMTTPQKATALAQLQTLGITNRTDYGV